MPIPSTNLFTYLLSFFGFGPAKTEHFIQHPTYEGSSCSFQTDSTLYVTHLDANKKRTLQDTWAFQDWISRLSKVALCQILTSTINDYPQVADRIENFYSTFPPTTAVHKEDDWLDSILFIQERARTATHSLDKLRLSEQFGRAYEVAESIQGLIQLCTQHNRSFMSHVSLFGLIILAQESLQAPAEVRQHVFYHAKLGRSIILELATVLKNFKTRNLHPCNQWERVSSVMHIERKENWVDALDRVCIKLARYDVTWEYRQEYSQVVEIATRLYNTKILR